MKTVIVPEKDDVQHIVSNKETFVAISHEFYLTSRFWGDCIFFSPIYSNIFMFLVVSFINIFSR